MKKLYLLVSALLLLSMTVVNADQVTDHPGDDFRRTAEEYEVYAYRAKTLATKAQGETAGYYHELAQLYEEMSAIKRYAAELADQHRWNDINWDRYYQLASKRDVLLGHLQWDEQNIHGQANTYSDNGGYENAADSYTRQAEEARVKAERSEGMLKSLYELLANVYAQMAQLKREAVAGSEAGIRFDWNEYRKLERERDKVLRQISHAER